MKKALGRGLDSLLNFRDIEKFFTQALEYDEKGMYLYAFYFYMKTTEIPSPFTSKALNNAAVILAEHDFIDEAIELLTEALKYDPNNLEAQENLKILKGEET